MKNELKRIGLLVILPLLLASLALYYIGEAEAVQYEEVPVLKQGGQRIQPELGSEDEPEVTPIIGIIGIEQ